MIHVVSGVAIRDGRVLLGKRKPDKLRPDLWELPGGKVKTGETSTGALCREWIEELGVQLRSVGRCVSRVTLHADVSLAIDLFPVDFNGEPQLLDHSKIAWELPFDAVRYFPCSPAFYLHYADLREYMQRGGMWREA